LIGQKLSHFEITAKLGEGGMGEVYRATDLNLKREVAIKILPPETAGDPQRLERFQREAEAVAALNHPNIVTIYSVERVDETPFIAMELVDGTSLDRALPPSGMPLAKALDVALGIAEALAVAHDKGVIHRDLKPGNVMLTSDGRVKVLDFGLAKLTEDGPDAAPEDLTLEMPTEAAPLTGEGVVLGTAPYMSPEQAQGRVVDQRSDIFSLGSILYEAATGIRPFSGESSIDTLHKIIHQEPAPLSERIPQAPLQLQWILRKALAKATEDRYQSARDLAVDLRATRRDLESDSDLVTLTSGQLQPPPQPKKSPAKWVVLAAAAVVVAGGLYWLFGWQGDGPGAEPEPAREMSIRPLTSSGLVTGAAISPDGKYVAHFESDQGEQSLHLRQLSGSESLELLPRAPVGFWGVTFTPDSTAILYAVKSTREPLGAFYRISTLGGSSRKLVSAIDSPPAVSPDGTRIAWLRAAHPEPSQSSLMVAGIDGSDPRILASVETPEFLVPRFFTGPSWSPDGRLIAASIMRLDETRHGWVAAFDAESGAPVWASRDRWPWLAMVAWLPEGDGLLVVGEPDGSPDSQIWHLPYPEGERRRVTNDLLDYRIVSLTADGSALLTIPTNRQAGIWRMPTDGSGRARRISRAVLDGLYGFAVTPDDRIVHQTLEAGQLDLAIMNADGSDRRLLTDDPDTDRFPVMASGDRVVWSSTGSTGTKLKEIDLETGESRTVFDGSIHGFSRPSAHPDAGLVFEHVSDGISTLWRIAPGSTDPTRLTDYEAFLPTISPDGRRLAFAYRESDGNLRIGITGITGGRPLVSLDQPISVATGSLIRWTTDGQALLVNTVANDRSNLWRLSLDGGPPQRLTDFLEQRIAEVGYSADGRTIFFARGSISRDAVLIENFR
jgi:serine/threonine protein kinase